MAGDLLIENLTFDEKDTFQSAGATIVKSIFHSDRSWGQYQNILNQQLTAPPPARRANLPAHAYITFDANNAGLVQAYCDNKVNKAKLNNALVKCSRPLGVVSANPNLANWPGNGTWDAAANIILAALANGSVVIEYYKLDGAPIMDVFGKDTDWKKIPE
ncbi:hypothetical protein MED121_08613 [Marinomonas sp. MED121]|uniref:hypothetical protein n=1 Tax=Marinomonas sp. MED121 TaxID=314277 RepID=UPI0000690068|nr:hypothetical protein [Marinomonas sp. MED121]EAQ65613.1 hypothetical protein MED121_08613 [Marinomonas sp. MED121]